MAQSARRPAPRARRGVHHLSEAALKERTRNQRQRRRARNLILALVFLGIFALGFNRVVAYEDPLTRSTLTLSGPIAVPVLEMRPASGETPLVAVVAHGFAGSKDLMTGFGVELARAGITTYLFDFPGHGASPAPLNGDISSDANAQSNLTALGEVVDYARSHNQATHSPRIILLGHSMGSAAVGDYAMAHATAPDLVATILVSPVGLENPTPSVPKNLLMLVGQQDLPFTITNSSRLLQAGCGQSQTSALPAECGNPHAGSGRRAVELPGLNHITILNASSTFQETLSWLQRGFPGQVSTNAMQSNTRLAWLLLGVAGILLAIFPISALLLDMFDVNSVPRAFSGQDVLLFDFCALLGIAAAIGIQYVWRPFSFLGLLLGDYVAGYFLFAALVTTLLTLIIRRKIPVPMLRQVLGQVVVGLLLGAILYFALGSLATFAWQHFTLTTPRLWRFALLLLLILPIFLLDEGIHRGLQEGGLLRGILGSLLFKLLLIGGLFVAVLLTPGLDFLSIVLPVLVLVMLLLVAFCTQLYLSGRAAIAAAVLSAFVIAWSIAASFPITS